MLQKLKKVSITAIQTLTLTVSVAVALTLASSAFADDFFVYNIYKSLDMGDPKEVPQKDYYVTVGKGNGVQNGTVLDVYRKAATYNLETKKLYKDVTFPIARLKVIHTESGASIARLEKMLDPDTTTAITPRAVLVGDLVKFHQ